VPVKNAQLSYPNTRRSASPRCLLLSMIVLMALLVSGCGYHLRGAFSLPKELQSIYLEGASSRLRSQFNEVLKSSSGQLTSTPKGAGIVVKIYNENQSRRVLSLSSRGKSNEFELEHRLEYELSNAQDQVLLPREPVNVRRAYYNDQQDIIAKDNEENVISNEMTKQIVRTIMNRARAVLEAKGK
jgi:LPS-assembly lipoprotein